MRPAVLAGRGAILSTALVFMLSGTVAQEPTEKESPSPEASGLKVESSVVDVGDVVRGQDAKATFVFRNTTARELRILGVKPACGCTVASFDATIAPGKTGTVTATVHTGEFRGSIEKAVAVTTDDPAAAMVELRIQANVVGSVVVLPRPGMAFPSGLDWDYSGALLVRKDETEKGVLNVTNVSTTAPWLLAKARRVESVEAATDRLPKALPGDFVLSVTVGSDAPKTQEGFAVKFRTGLPREPEVTIPVSVVLQSPMRATPSPLYIPAPADAAKEASGTFSAIVRPGLGKEKVTATVTPDPFAVKIEPDGERRYKATVRWKQGGGTTPREGTIVLQIGGESITVLVVVAEPAPASTPKGG